MVSNVPVRNACETHTDFVHQRLDQQIKDVSSDEYEAFYGGPPIPFSEIVRRIHLEHPTEAYEAKPNVACKEIKPACVNAFLCPL
jgi:hypothetical protein